MRFKFIGLLILIIVFVASSAFARTGDIIFKNGKKFKNVEYRVQIDKEKLILNPTGRGQVYDFSEIEAIYDSQGNNISRELLGRRDGVQDSDIWKSSSDGKIKKSLQTPWRVKFHAFGGFSISAGDYYKGAEGGVAFGGSISIPVNHQLAIKGTISRSGVSLYETGDIFYSEDPQFELQNQELSMSIVRYSFTFEYFRDSRPDEHGLSNYNYFYTGISGLNNLGKFEVDIVSTLSGASIHGITKSDDWNFALSLGGGYLVFMSENIGMDLGLHWDMVFAKGLYQNRKTGQLKERYDIAGHQFELRMGIFRTF